MAMKAAMAVPCRSRTRQNKTRRPRSAEHGAIAMMTAIILIFIIAMFGFALDLSRSFNRKTELQAVADNTALAAANALDGSAAGIDNAVKAAAATASTFSFSYNNAFVEWSPAALTFSTDPDGGQGGWVDGTSVKAKAGKVFYARVDTSMLDASHGRVENVLLPILSSNFKVTNVGASAVAGRDSLHALPLAICANSNTPVSSIPPGELVEYGFRRGISYDLMKLSPSGGPAQNFLVNPIAPAGTVGASMMGRMDLISPYVCTGQMAIPALQGGDITVEPGFPIASLYPQLNSRFGTSGTLCQPSSAPADSNLTSFDLAGAAWIKSQPPDLSVGPLWSYAKAVKYSSYVANNGIEPVAGYTPYAATTADWAALYPGSPPAQPQSYPAPTPYQNTGGAGAYKTLYNTRVLRIPLLQCPVPPGAKVTATVLGIGKFFMTIPATSSTIYAEFAGMENWATIGGNARIYR